MLVVRGLIRVYMTSPEGRQVTVRYARACDVLGIAVLVGGLLHSEYRDPAGL
jgi:CRP/FNR family transcriptional regulator, cyclic AMP receptor protein